MERNVALQFTESEVEYIENILKDFSIIANKLGVNISSTGTVLTTDREAMELYYITSNGKFSQYHKKQVNWIWQHVVENIKAELFGELKRISTIKA